jgi:hypothetical protein
MHRFPYRRVSLLLLAVSALTALVLAPSASGTHVVPGTADALTIKLVENYRQTITDTACASQGRTVGEHSSPLSLVMPSSCLPPQFAPGTAARLGPSSDSSIKLTAIQEDPSTLGDQADLGLEAHLKNVVCNNALAAGCGAGAGTPYLPNPSGPDVNLKVKLRVSDDTNCAGSGCTGPYTSAGTGNDFELAVPVDCTAAAPAASCDLITSAEAFIGLGTGVIVGGSQYNIQVFRVRVTDSGADGVLGGAPPFGTAGDDRDFAMQGLAIH